MKKEKAKGKRSLFRRQGLLQMFALVGMLYLLIFTFLPMGGLVMSFKNYTIDQTIIGILTSK